MKIQDTLFLVALVILLALRKQRYFVFAGLGSLTLAIPLFAGWVFFTAERLTWYAAGFFLIYLLFSLVRPHTVQ